MFIDTTQRQRIGVKAIIPTLALLMLLGAGCSEKETTAPEEDASAHAPAHRKLQLNLMLQDQLI
jgi:hypothetical protein